MTTRAASAVRQWRWPTTGGHRLAAGVVAVVATVLLLVLLVVTSLGASAALDLVGHRHVHGTPGSAWTSVARGVTTAGGSLVLYPVIAAAGWLLSARAGWMRLGDALVGPVVLGIGSGLRWGLSVAVGRTRPPTGDWLTSASGFAFPSGHTTNVTVAVGVLALLFGQGEDRRWRRGCAWVVAVVAAGAVGWSRVYLGVHWPTDVLAGWLFGVAWVGLAALLGDQITLRARSRCCRWTAC